MPARISDRVCDVVADKFQCGFSWRTLAGDLQPKIKDGLINALEEDRRRCPKECVRAALVCSKNALRNTQVVPHTKSS